MATMILLGPGMPGPRSSATGRASPHHALLGAGPLWPIVPIFGPIPEEWPLCRPVPVLGELPGLGANLVMGGPHDRRWPLPDAALRVCVGVDAPSGREGVLPRSTRAGRLGRRPEPGLFERCALAGPWRMVGR